jgi:hypothetical protein
MQIIIVQKGGSLKEAEVSASWTVEELASKAGFRKHDGFALVHTYDVSAKKKKSTKSGSSTGAKLLVEVYGKQSGRAGSENKYDFPPPIDSQLFFGAMALVLKQDGVDVSLPKKIWEKYYEKLFGGFEDLTAAHDDDNEPDELENIASSLKTQDGYLKDGFVVDGEDSSVGDFGMDDDTVDSSAEADSEVSDTSDDVLTKSSQSELHSDTEDDDEDGSELSVEAYTYSDEDENDEP